MPPKNINAFTAEVSGALTSEIAGALQVNGLPREYEVKFTDLPQVRIKVDPIKLETLRIDPIEIRLTQWPSMRVHLPADYTVGLSVFGREIFRLRLCGEGQAITEPYVPGPCERPSLRDRTVLGVPVGNEPS